MTFCLQRRCKGHSIFPHLADIVLKFGCGTFFELHSQGSNCVLMGASLAHWEDCSVNVVLVVVPFASPVENHPTSWSSQCFVGGAGHNVCILERAVSSLTSDQTTNMCHVTVKDGSTCFGNFLQSGIVPFPWVC